MKILLITNELSEKSGWGRYSVDLVASLVKNNHEVSIICQTKNLNFDYSQHEILPSPLSFKKNYLLCWLSLFKFINICKQFKPDVIHCIVESYSPSACLISFISRKEYIVTAHGSFAIKPFRNYVYSLIQEFVYKRAKNIVAVSNYTKKQILLKSPKLSNIVIINNGVSDYFLIKARNSKRAIKPIILSVGALKHRKGFHISISAFAEVANKFPDYVYYLIGDSSDIKYVDSLRNIISREHLEHRIKIISDVDDERLFEMYEQSKLFILTPVSDEYNFEGFGLVYLEANAFGIPVIGSLDNGGEDAINDGMNGFLSQKSSVSDVSKKISLVLSDNILYNSLSLNGKVYAEKMSWSNKVQEYIKLYL